VIQPVVNVNGAVNAAGLIQLATVSPHGLLANDLVEVLGVLGTIESNGQWVVSSVPDSTHLVLANSHFSRNYISGGIVQHIGWIPGVIATPATGFTITTRLESLSSQATCRVVYEDATDPAFVTGQPLAALGAGPGNAASDGQYLTLPASTFQALPDVRAGYLRVKAYLQNPWTSATLSAWTV
jgi:hypothetical protein